MPLLEGFNFRLSAGWVAFSRAQRPGAADWVLPGAMMAHPPWSQGCIARARTRCTFGAWGWQGGAAWGWQQG
jgi:hypothetical protein